MVFLPGEDSVIINLSPIQDGLDEGFESVTITVELVNICGDTIVSSGVIYIGDGPIINIDESDTFSFVQMKLRWEHPSPVMPHTPMNGPTR